MGETGYRQISNRVRTIRGPDDMKGIKIRVVGSPMYGEIMPLPSGSFSISGCAQQDHEL